jgi:hypothetical protein
METFAQPHLELDQWTGAAQGGGRGVLDALAHVHDDIRTQLAAATAEPEPIGEAARHLAKVCLPHLALVEETAFPAFAMLQTLFSGGERADSSELLALIDDFSGSHDDLIKQNQSMVFVIDPLWEAAYEEGNREVVAFTRNLRSHKRIEEQVLFPVLLLIGKYLQKKLAISGGDV